MKDSTRRRLSDGFAGVLVTVVSTLLVLGLLLLIDPVRHGIADAVRGDTETLREELRGDEVGGALIVIALALVHAVVFYPAEILNIAAGYVYGAEIAIPLVMVGWMLSAFAAYAIGRYAGRPVLRRVLGLERVTRAERVIDRGGIPALLAVRLIPVIPFSLICYVAGAARVRLWPFTWTTFVGTLPLTSAVVLLGERIEHLSLTDPLLYVALVPILILLAAVPVLGRRLRGTADEPDAQRTETLI